MNKVILMGRITKDIDVKYTAGDNPTAMARYTLAVKRRFSREGEQDTDFINCVAFGKQAEFAGKYFKQGTKLLVCGRIQTRSYTNRNNVKVYVTEVVIEEQDFAESKAVNQQNNNSGGVSSEYNANQGRHNPQALEQSLTGGFTDVGDNDIPFL